jgi:hypothetical protein
VPFGAVAYRILDRIDGDTPSLAVSWSMAVPSQRSPICGVTAR